MMLIEEERKRKRFVLSILLLALPLTHNITATRTTSIVITAKIGGPEDGVVFDVG